MTETDPQQRPDVDPMFLWPFAGIRIVLALGAAIAATLVFFRLFPSVDIAASRMFFEQIACEGGKVCGSFPISASAPIQPIRQLLQAMPVVLAIALLAVILWRVIVRQSGIDSFNAAGISAVLSLVLGAGVVVNVILKEFWGRPRPVFTDLFGGPFPFVPAGQITDHCEGNCSFVSGEAAGAFWLVGLAALAPAPYRIPAMIAAFCAAAFTSFLRITFGGHYLSDVVIAALISLFVFSVVASIARRLIAKPSRAR